MRQNCFCTQITIFNAVDDNDDDVEHAVHDNRDDHDDCANRYLDNDNDDNDDKPEEGCLLFRSKV